VAQRQECRGRHVENQHTLAEESAGHTFGISRSCALREQRPAPSR
jgi:hypothetical protein